MNIKQKILALSVAAAIGTISYANYTIIINPDKSSISFSKPQWVQTDAKFVAWVEPAKDNEFYRYDCQTWTPAPETEALGKTFTQTANDCKGKQFAQMVAQEVNNVTKEVRNVGEPYIDTSNEKVLTDLTHTQEAVGTKSVYLTILNPVQGQSGIYQISDGKSGSFPAYVNMTDDGGNWILIARWTSSPAGTVTFNNFAVKGNPITTYSNSSASYPVLPTGSKNESSRMLIKSSGASWSAAFGKWQSFSTFAPGTVIGSSGISASTSIGAKTLFIRANGWYTQIPQDMTSIVGFFSAYSNGGACGGANVVGYNPMCLTYTNDSGSHFDAASLKEAYIKALN